MRIFAVVLGLTIVAVVATYARYQSLHPCDWLERDTAEASGLPALAAQARIRAGFLIDGIVDPGASDCLTAWWDLRSEAAAAQ